MYKKKTFCSYTYLLLQCHIAKYISVFVLKVEVKVQVYSLISSLKAYHQTLHLTPWSLDQFIRVPFQLHGEHTVLRPFRSFEIIIHIAISVLPGTQVKHLRVKGLAQGHNIFKVDLCAVRVSESGRT